MGTGLAPVPPLERPERRSRARRALSLKLFPASTEVLSTHRMVE
jgi:hypothetical protein